MENICLLIEPFIDTDTYLIIEEKLQEKTRKNIIEIINILNTQKNNFRKKNELDKYNQTITNLYKILENTKLNNNLENIIEKIKDYNQFIKLDKEEKEIILENLPILNYCINKDTKEKYKIQLEPIVVQNHEQKKVINIIKFLLGIIDTASTTEKIFISLTIYDYIFRNFSLVESNLKFAKACYQKLIEFIDYSIYDKIKSTIKKVGYDENTFEIWKSVFENRNLIKN